MWHGHVGHWIINDTPGDHGNDRAKSVFGEYMCPPDILQWEVKSNGNYALV